VRDRSDPLEPDAGALLADNGRMHPPVVSPRWTRYMRRERHRITQMIQARSIVVTYPEDGRDAGGEPDGGSGWGKTVGFQG
jgi:hypothetical protein